MRLILPAHQQHRMHFAERFLLIWKAERLPKEILQATPRRSASPRAPMVMVSLSVPPWWHLANRLSSGVCEVTCPEAMKALKWGVQRAIRPAGGAAGQLSDIYQQVSSPAVDYESTGRAGGNRLGPTKQSRRGGAGLALSCTLPR